MGKTGDEELYGVESKHPSFAMIGVSRLHCGGTGGGSPLFGSSIIHNEIIRIGISTASVARKLNCDWYHADCPLIEVDLSLSQWAEFISSQGKGDGVPCTLHTKDGKHVEPPPYVGKRKQFSDEFAATCRKIGKLFDELKSFVAGLRDKPSVSKAERAELSKKVDHLRMWVDSNMPFVAIQFNEQMDLTAKEAKGEVEAFFLRKIMDLGLSALADQIKPPMIGDAETSGDVILELESHNTDEEV